ncbi:tRNA (cytidine(56)-2'-O)-methyltransferase [archaeon]|nr:tRNA (cytidine(56)-2'-O)-methyltransferase [archaeon]
MTITVLRLGHRAHRDHRVTTHCALAARAFGADAFVFSGERDSSIILSVNDVVKRWGGPFDITYEFSWRRWLAARKKATIVHLTMYGRELEESIPKIRKIKGDLIIIVGGEKVPREVYELADYNVSVTLQPHSEVASIAVFLDRYFKGKELTKTFHKPELRIVPQDSGKEVEEVKSE